MHMQLKKVGTLALYFVIVYGCLGRAPMAMANSSRVSQLWSALIVRKDFAKSPWSLQSEFQARNQDQRPELRRLGFNPRLDYQINHELSVGFAVAYFANNSSPGAGFRIERRTQQQIQFIGENLFDSLPQLSLNLRARLEQRYFEDDPVVRHRLRPRLRFDWKLDEDYTIYVYNEGFLSFNGSRDGSINGISSNRLGVGSLIQVNKTDFIDASILEQQNLARSHVVKDFVIRLEWNIFI
jgi:hypothetical protein